MLFEQGKLEKLTIMVLEYADGCRPEVSEAEEDKYTVQVNPASYSISKQIHYQAHQPQGSQEATQQYARSGTSNISLEFMFDGTGVISTQSTLDEIPLVGAVASLFSEEEPFDVYTEIQKFESVVYQYDGTTHQPNKVKVIWGTLIFEGAISTLNYSYTLFNPDGTPLRAKATCSFLVTKSAEQIEFEANNSSPDLTHIREFKDGDTLPLLAHRIYGNPGLYLELARVNKLINFRRIQAGQRVALPPIDKRAGR